MRLQVEPLRPCGELLAAGAAAEDLALDKLCVGAAGRELLERFTHAGAAGGRKEDDGLAGEIVALEEGVDDGRRNVPPDREVKCSQFLSCLDFTGLNSIQNCVLCCSFCLICQSL